ncbi:MAG: NADH:flavin oxidoreductase [Muribaculaceae bacterium]|nr:NADH:flavin oxidoreductase [Muribaculaceae bacterium]
METEKDILFSPAKIGPVTLRNRTIRSAAFEGMADGNRPTQMLRDYHVSVARGGVGMTTLAYASVTRNGLSFKSQLWMRPEIVGELRAITDDIHQAGAKASVQLGHCGNMSHKSTAGETPISASGGFNLYSPTLVRKMRVDEIEEMARSFGEAVRMAKDSGFDCVEIHAGHGYLISQFLSPYTNRRRDCYGGSLDNRMRFMRMCMEQVMKAANGEIGVLVKTNMRDGFRGGIEVPEAITIAKELESLGADALVLSGGFVSKAPMYVMRGPMPIRSMTHYMSPWWLKYGVKMFGSMMIPTVPYRETYFLDDAVKFRKELKLPLVYVGGCSTREGIDRVLAEGFEFIQMGRALLRQPDFVNRMRQGENSAGCDHVNYCIARMYSREMACHHCAGDLPGSLINELEKLKRKAARKV